MMGQIGVADHGADAKTAVGELLDGVEADVVDVDESGGALNIEFHEVEQSGAAGDKADILIRGGADGLVSICGANIGEEFHRGSWFGLRGYARWRTCWMAATMLG